jgi:hypothetical protein
MEGKLLLRLVFLLSATTALLYAQADNYVDWEVKRLEQKLDLTAPQIERVKAELEQLREQNQGDRDAVRSAEKDVEDTMRGQIKAILTAEQLEKFAEIRESVHLPRPMQDNRLKVMKDRLKLSDEQSARIEQILLDEREQVEALRGTSDPARQGENMKQRPGGHGDFDRQGPPPAMKKIWQETDQKIEALLSPEQLKEYQKIKQERSKHMHGPDMGEPPPGMGGRQQF